MSKGVITDVGRAYIAAQDSASQPVNLTTFKLGAANIGGDTPTDPDPTTTDIATPVFTGSKTYEGYLNPDSVAITLILGTAEGDYDITQVGLYSDTGVLVYLAHIPTFYKRKDDVGVSGNGFVYTAIVEYAGVTDLTGITVPADSAQFNFEARLEGSEENTRAGRAALLGRLAALDAALLISEPARQVLDDAEALTNWAADVGSLVLDAADFVEGANSLHLSGHAAVAKITKTPVTAEDWTTGQHNGVLLMAKAGAAMTANFFAESTGGARSLYQITIGTTWAEAEVDLPNPTSIVGGGADLSAVTAWGVEDIDSGVELRVDDLRLAHLNDLVVNPGAALAEGLLIDRTATRYRSHHTDWGLTGSPAPLTPPGAGTRSDVVYLDAWDETTFAGHVHKGQILVAEGTALPADYVDGLGRQHYCVALATALRTTTMRITTAMLTDTRRVLPNDGTHGPLGEHGPAWLDVTGKLQESHLRMPQGGVEGLVMVNGATPAAQLDVNIRKLWLGGFEFSDLDMTADMGVSGVGGLASDETEAISTWYHVWAIANTTDPANPLANVLLSKRWNGGTGSEDPASMALPAGYTHKRYLGAVYNNAAGDFEPVMVADGWTKCEETLYFTSITSTSLTSFGVTESVIPPNAKRVWVELSLYLTGGSPGTTHCYISINSVPEFMHAFKAHYVNANRVNSVFPMPYSAEYFGYSLVGTLEGKILGWEF